MKSVMFLFLATAQEFGRRWFQSHRSYLM